MLRLRDARTGRWHEFAGPMPMRVHVGGSGPRTLLVADLIRRIGAAVQAREPIVTSAAGGGLPDWNIHPAAADDRIEAADVVVDSGSGDSCVLGVGRLEVDATGDPLVLRLAALEFHYSEVARLDRRRVAAAETALRAWRATVARWASAPGAPMSRPHAQRLAAAFENDLATPQALHVLRELEDDPSVSAGAKFETFAFADRLLGVDLARDVGS
jgi:hypothetical protein